MIRKKKVMFEEDLHDVFYRYPYLIINEPNSIIETIHEYELDSNSILDIYIETKTKKIYCEVKITKLKEKDLYQALRYLNAIHNNIEENEKKDIVVILIGMKSSNNLRETANRRGIKIMVISNEIPDSIKICKKCRKAYNSRFLKCSFCDSTEIFEIITLKYP
ncbi:MAG: PD-(D/E)XK nuclease family protein [Promethearchaeota archaeon]